MGFVILIWLYTLIKIHILKYVHFRLVVKFVQHRRQSLKEIKVWWWELCELYQFSAVSTTFPWVFSVWFWPGLITIEICISGKQEGGTDLFPSIPSTALPFPSHFISPSLFSFLFLFTLKCTLLLICWFTLCHSLTARALPSPVPRTSTPCFSICRGGPVHSSVANSATNFYRSPMSCRCSERNTKFRVSPWFPFLSFHPILPFQPPELWLIYRDIRANTRSILSMMTMDVPHLIFEYIYSSIFFTLSYSY